MISIILLVKIIGGICFIISWVFMFLGLRRMQRQFECLYEHCDERLTAMAQSIGQSGDDSAADDLTESQHKAAEAERRFNEGIASILNFSASAAVASDGKKGDYE